MSVEAISWAWKTATEARGTDLLVLLALADYADDDHRAWPKIATLAEKCRVSEKTVRRSIRSLEDLGLVEVVRHQEESKSSDYLLALPSGQIDRGGSGQIDRRPRSPVTGPPGQIDRASKEGEPSVEPSENRARFEDFWAAYPRRNGRRVGKKAAEAKWAKLAETERGRAMTAVLNYAAAVEAEKTIAKDAQRFLASGYFEDWVEETEEGSSDPWPVVLQAIQRFGRTRVEEARAHVAASGPPGVMEAVRDAGWANLCRMSLQEAERAFRAAYALPRSGPPGVESRHGTGHGPEREGSPPGEDREGPAEGADVEEPGGGDLPAGPGRGPRLRPLEARVEDLAAKRRSA